MIISGEIKNIYEWYVKAGPKSRETQWVKNHSALEFAKLVLDNSFENDIKENILNKISVNQKVVFAIPEQITRLDEYNGGQRNHDLALYAENETEKIAICFEAKVNEDLDVILSKKWEEGNKKNSNIHNRIKNIIHSLLKNSQIENYNELKYQLLTGLYGTIKFAEELNIKKCVFCIYQIQVDEKTKVKKTEYEIQKLIDCFNINDKVRNNKLFGPFKTTNNIEFYISYLKREKIAD
ncbi:DUF6946 family protein [Xanthomarina gelatinilytica]|uniref:DUF6946 family protein n=1 Tax=Xanthomarina gelatinilytica TaxID=1137281 RepID=UPI003AA9937A